QGRQRARRETDAPDNRAVVGLPQGQVAIGDQSEEFIEYGGNLADGEVRQSGDVLLRHAGDHLLNLGEGAGERDQFLDMSSLRGTGLAAELRPDRLTGKWRKEHPGAVVVPGPGEGVRRGGGAVVRQEGGDARRLREDGEVGGFEDDRSLSIIGGG